MNTSTVKGDRKREIGQSPIKKEFRDATISREDIDEAIANGIKLAFKEQQSFGFDKHFGFDRDFGSESCCGLCADSSIT